MAELQGFRLPDTEQGELPVGIARGAFWKVLEDGKPKVVQVPGKLTVECWRLCVPWKGDRGYAIANLDHHTVREETDGMISVRPNDGSSNSILVGAGHLDGRSWHGYVECGLLYES